MGYPLKQSQTAQPLLFLMVDSSDHITGKTGLSPAVTLSKNGGSFASPAGAVSEIANGWYQVAGNTTDSDTLGPMLLHATGTGADPTDDRFDVVSYDPQDATRLGLSALPNADAEASGGLPTLSAAQASNGTIQANVHRWLTGTPNALQSGRVDSYLGAVAAGVIAATSFAANALDAVWSTATRTLTSYGTLTTDVATAVWAALTSALTTVGSIGKRLVDDIDATISSRSTFDAASDTVTVGANNDKTGYAIAVGGIDATSFAASAVDAAALATDAVDEIRDSILSDATPFAGADIDAAISSRASQADILSDATPFPGADVALIKAKTDNLPESIKKGAALSNFEFFMVSSVDHVSGATGLTVTAQRSIDGGAFGSCTNAVSEVGSGVYKINLSTADTNGTVVTYLFTATGADARVITVKTAL